MEILDEYGEKDRFIDTTKPYIKKYSDIELSKISSIEQKLRNVLSENSEKGFLFKGITENEAEILLEWVVQKDRQLLMMYHGYNLEDLSLLGSCKVSQTIVVKLLTNMGLDPRCSNINHTIKNYTGSDHGFTSVNFPIINENQKIEDKNFLIDVTYRQFFLKDEFNMFGIFINDERFENKVALLPGYLCINLPGGKDFAEVLLKNGYIELTPKNAKLYGDSFLLGTMRVEKYIKNHEKDFTIPVLSENELITGISSEQYLEDFIDSKNQDIPMYDNTYLEYYFNIGENDLKTPFMQEIENNGTELVTMDYMQKMYNENCKGQNLESMCNRQILLTKDLKEAKNIYKNNGVEYE